jgi:hypothetical protein
LAKRLLQWDDNHMAQGGRETMIKAVAQALPNYVMGVYKLPLGLCDNLTKVIRNFWWEAEKVKKEALIGLHGALCYGQRSKAAWGLRS